MMTSLAARLQDECSDNLGADGARSAAEALIEAARAVQAAVEAGDSALLAAALVRLNEATVAAEEVYHHQVSIVLLMEAGYVQGYAAGQAARGLRLVR